MAAVGPSSRTHATASAASAHRLLHEEHLVGGEVGEDVLREVGGQLAPPHPDPDPGEVLGPQRLAEGAQAVVPAVAPRSRTRIDAEVEGHVVHEDHEVRGRAAVRGEHPGDGAAAAVHEREGLDEQDGPAAERRLRHPRVVR